MKEQQDTGFIRQRRNLMIASLVLLFSEITNLKVEKINVFGTELLIEHPQAVTQMIWVAVIYWLIRYYQYSHGFYDSMHSSILERIQKTCQPVAKKVLISKEPSLLEPVHDVNATPTLDSEILGFNYKRSHLYLKLSLTKVAYDGKASSTQGIGERTVQLHGMNLYWLRVKAWLHVIMNTTIFTDWVLPYIVFALPVLYAGYKAIR